MSANLKYFTDTSRTTTQSETKKVKNGLNNQRRPQMSTLSSSRCLVSSSDHQPPHRETVQEQVESNGQEGPEGQEGQEAAVAVHRRGVPAIPERILWHKVMNELLFTSWRLSFHSMT